MTPSVEERLDALDHVLYEMEMFVALPTRCEMTEVRNAIVESYLAHARVLCDFFQKERWKDDVICGDYEFERKTLGVSNDIEQRFDKSLAHLTYSRLKFEGDTKNGSPINFVLNSLRGFASSYCTSWQSRALVAQHKSKKHMICLLV